MEITATILTFILLFFAAYGFILVVSGSFYQTKKAAPAPLPKIKVLLPAYQPDHVFLDVLEHLKKAIKHHPVDVLILFQRADTRIIEASKMYGFEMVCRNFDHLSGNSYRHALQFLTGKYLDENTHKYTVIFDKDNLVKEDFF